MVNINIEIKKGHLWIIIGVFLFVGLGVVMATNWNDAKTMFHNAEDVRIDSLDKSLEDAVSEGDLGVSFGEWQDVTDEAVDGSVQGPADSDGFVVVSARGSGHGNGQIVGYNGDTSSSLEIYTASGSGYVDVHWSGITMPVKEGDYWKVSFYRMESITIRWIPVS